MKVLLLFLAFIPIVFCGDPLACEPTESWEVIVECDNTDGPDGTLCVVDNLEGFVNPDDVSW